MYTIGASRLVYGSRSPTVVTRYVFFFSRLTSELLYEERNSFRVVVCVLVLAELAEKTRKTVVASAPPGLGKVALFTTQPVYLLPVSFRRLASI